MQKIAKGQVIRYSVMAAVAAGLLFVGFKAYFPRFFHPVVIVLMALLGAYVTMATFTIKKTNFWAYVIVYSVLLVVMLFFRKPYDTFKMAKPIGIKKYFETLFDSSVNILGLLGNAVLFFPMGIIVGELPLKRKWKILCLLGVALLLVPLIEVVQYFTKVGVLDFVDILWNGVSISLGALYSLLLYRKKKE